MELADSLKRNGFFGPVLNAAIYFAILLSDRLVFFTKV